MGWKESGVRSQEVSPAATVFNRGQDACAMFGSLDSRFRGNDKLCRLGRGFLIAGKMPMPRFV